MKSRILLVALSLLTIYSCKNEKKLKKHEEITAPVKVEVLENKNSIYVLMNVKVLQDDVFEIYYYEPGSNSFSSKDFVFTRVNGQPNFQEIKIELPNDMYPERLRLDMGKNKNQEAMILNSVSLVWEDKKYEFTKSEIEREFRPSKYMTYNDNTSQIETKVIEGKYDPYFYTMKLNNIIDYLLED